MIHGTEIVRQPDGALGGWKSEYTTIAWRAQLEGGRVYRLRVLTETSPARDPAMIEAVASGQVLRGHPSGAEGALDFGTFTADRTGPRLLLLRAAGQPGADGFPVVRGAEFVPER